MKRCLVVGGGGREHALVRALLRSPQVTEVLAAPGNAGIFAEPGARCVDVASTDVEGLVELARSAEVALTVVGPEAPLVAGLVDRFRAAGQRVLGPVAAAAHLEGSKVFCKEVLEGAGVPTPAWQVFSDLEAARAALPDGPVVVKADGLAAGKGVVVASDRAEADAALVSMLGDRRFGAAGARVLVERCLVGEEVSVIALCDGERALCFPPAQDHKRIGEGDSGPNTGGMGAYAPAPCLDAAGCDRVTRDVLEPVLAEMRRRGAPFHGFLYAGLMLTAEGPYVLEFNVRFGDPEAQPLLELLASDAFTVFCQAADGALTPDALAFHEGAAACVVLASAGYPASSSKGDRIEGLEDAAAVDGVTVVHAGTRREGDAVLTDGGRVLGVTAHGEDLRAALDACYAAVDRIGWPGMQYRRDIGHRALTS